MPKLTYDSKDAIPEGFADFAKEEDGKWSIDVVPKGKLDGFRENNISLSKERDSLKDLLDSVKKVTGDDLDKLADELAELRAVDQQVKDGKLKGSSAVEAEVANRLKAAKEEYERQVASKAQEATALKAERDETNMKLANSYVSSAVTQAVLASDSALNPEAMPDILTRAGKVFVVENDKLVAKKDGAVIYGADGVSPLSPKEWLNKLVEEAPYLAKPSHGGGAAGGEKKGAPGGLTKEAFNKLPPAERIRLHRTQGGA